MDSSIQPWQQLLADRQAAAAANDACAGLCYLATVDNAGLPQVRTLVLRDLPGDQLGLFINSTSPKWQQLQAPVSVLVYLPSLAVQYRVRATLTALEKNTVDESWLLRPPTPKRLDWYYEAASAQSTPIHSREHLLRSLDDQVPEVPQTAPASAQGLLLQPSAVERLDLNADGGPHDRRLFNLRAGRWEEEVLVP